MSAYKVWFCRNIGLFLVFFSHTRDDSFKLERLSYSSLFVLVYLSR